jgi:hypothetical protein
MLYQSVMDKIDIKYKKVNVIVGTVLPIYVLSLRSTACLSHLVGLSSAFRDGSDLLGYMNKEMLLLVIYTVGLCTNALQISSISIHYI